MIVKGVREAEIVLDDFTSQMDLLISISEQIEKRIKQLNKQLSAADKKLADIEHYIEGPSLSASQGYRAYKMLREARICRRKIKLELDAYNNMANCHIRKKSLTKVKATAEEKGKCWLYKPRVLPELFTEGGTNAQ